jgi:hypothetical protein
MTELAGHGVAMPPGAMESGLFALELELPQV